MRLLFCGMSICFVSPRVKFGLNLQLVRKRHVNEIFLCNRKFCCHVIAEFLPSEVIVRITSLSIACRTHTFLANSKSEFNRKLTEIDEDLMAEAGY
jgi:hypothetical protein